MNLVDVYQHKKAFVQITLIIKVIKKLYKHKCYPAHQAFPNQIKMAITRKSGRT